MGYGVRSIWLWERCVCALWPEFGHALALRGSGKEVVFSLPSSRCSLEAIRYGRLSKTRSGRHDREGMALGGKDSLRCITDTTHVILGMNGVPIGGFSDDAESGSGIWIAGCQSTGRQSFGSGRRSVISTQHHGS
jgi:hypothetical protein